MSSSREARTASSSTGHKRKAKDLDEFRTEEERQENRAGMRETEEAIQGPNVPGKL